MGGGGLGLGWGSLAPAQVNQTSPKLRFQNSRDPDPKLRF